MLRNKIQGVEATDPIPSVDDIGRGASFCGSGTYIRLDMKTREEDASAITDLV
jgi:hypothetical protein